MLELYTESDHFGKPVTLLPGAMTEIGLTMDSTTLEFSIFTETANLAGRSMVLGGYHIDCENQESLSLGKKIDQKAWQKYVYHISAE